MVLKIALTWSANQYRFMKKIILPLLFAGFLSSCDQNSKNVEVVYDTIDTDTTLMAALPSPGQIFSGILPCSGCSGINTLLTINTDSSYALSETLMGTSKSDSIIQSSGKVEYITGTPVVYKLTPTTGDIKYFKNLGDSAVQLMDANMKDMATDANTILKRQ
jgi:hypothetical protein